MAVAFLPQVGMTATMFLMKTKHGVWNKLGMIFLGSACVMEVFRWQYSNFGDRQGHSQHGFFDRQLTKLWPTQIQTGSSGMKKNRKPSCIIGRVLLLLPFQTDLCARRLLNDMQRLLSISSRQQACNVKCVYEQIAAETEEEEPCWTIQWASENPQN